MTVPVQINRYIAALPSSKGEALRDLHHRILRIAPHAKLWFLDGRNPDGKVVSNPSIGYGSVMLGSASGGSRMFYRVGISASTGGLSAYVMGIPDKRYLAVTYGARLGKARVSGYCIRFRSARDVDLAVIEEIVVDALASGAAGAS